MKKIITNIKNLLILFFAVLVCFFASCSQNLPEINQANGTLVFEYENSEVLPETRLSVFVESESNPRRYAKIKVKSVENSFEWETEDIVKLQSDTKNYAGYTNFVMPDKEKFPKGKYTVIYINADEEEAESEFNIEYNGKIYELKASEIPAFMEKHNGINKIAIYDKDDYLIFFGERTNDFKTTRDIFNQFREADYFNDIWVSKNNSVICILPKELVKPEKVE